MSEMTYEEAVDRLEYMERLGRRNVSTTAARVILKRCEELEAIAQEAVETFTDFLYETTQTKETMKGRQSSWAVVEKLEVALAAHPKEQP